MSNLKVRVSDDVMWAPSVDSPEYNYDDLGCSLTSSWNYAGVTLKMSIHPDWLRLMDDLKVGDLVTTHEGDIGIISAIKPTTGLEIKRFEVNIDGKTNVFFSMNLKKMETKGDK